MVKRKIVLEFNKEHLSKYLGIWLLLFILGWFILSGIKPSVDTRKGWEIEMDKVRQSIEELNMEIFQCDAMVLMGNSEIKHLPVIDEGELVGIITGKDIMRIEPHLIEMLSFKASLDKEEAKKLFKKL